MQRSADSKAILMMISIVIQPLAPVYGTPVVAYTTRAFIKAGWTLYILAGFRPRPVDKELVERLHISWFEGSLLRTLRFLGRIPKIGFFARSIWWLVAQGLFFFKGFRIIAKHKIDLIYTWDAETTPAAWILSRLFGIPWVARYLGTPIQINKPIWKIRFWQQVLAYKLPADLIIMTNDGTQGDKILRNLWVNMGRVRFWLNGVDWDAFRFISSNKDAKELIDVGDNPTLLCLSRLDDWKRVDRALQALPFVLESFPNAVLIIVGDGPKRNELERLAIKLGIRKHVRFEGAVPHFEVSKYLAATDIFLSLYDWSNVGNPLLEAMMAGKCIVTINNGDTGQFVKNRENGILLEYKDLPKLPNVIKELLANEELRKSLGANARKFAEEHFWSWQERLDIEIAEVTHLVEQRRGHFE